MCSDRIGNIGRSMEKQSTSGEKECSYISTLIIVASYSRQDSGNGNISIAFFFA